LKFIASTNKFSPEINSIMELKKQGNTMKNTKFITSILTSLLVIGATNITVNAAPITSFGGTNCQEDVRYNSINSRHSYGGDILVTDKSTSGWVTVNCPLDMTSNVPGQVQGYKDISVYYRDGSSTNNFECTAMLRSIVGNLASFVTKSGGTGASTSIRGIVFPTSNSGYASPTGFLRCYMPKPDAGGLTHIISYTISR
jgi:hypothetical protein